MIVPKVPGPTKKEQREAYRTATTRDRNTCQRCLRNCGPIQRDHRKNRSQGGQTVVENLQLLGRKCHEWKTGHPTDANAEGWGVPSWADPAMWPAARWFKGEHNIMSRGWVLYDREGNFREITADHADRLMGVTNG
jgi:HNH endonuclease